MPNALTNTNISATYKGVLHADGEPIPASGLKPVYDGTGVQSALSIGRSNQGATVSGYLSSNDLRAGQLKMPNEDKGIENQVVARTTSGVLELKSLSDIIGGSTIANGVYDNPRITVSGNVITKIESRPSIVILDNPVILISDYNGDLGTSVNGIAQGQTYSETFNITWNAPSMTGFYADAPAITIPAKYAIITVELFIHSGSREFETRMLQDSKIIARARVDSNDTDFADKLDNNRYVYRNQQIVKIPTSLTSVFQFIIFMTEVESPPNRYNQAGRSVTLDGWVF
jgi:hypothetical protein